MYQFSSHFPSGLGFFLIMLKHPRESLTPGAVSMIQFRFLPSILSYTTGSWQQFLSSRTQRLNNAARKCLKIYNDILTWLGHPPTCPCHPRPSWDAPWPWEATPCPRDTAPGPVCPPPPPPSDSPRHSCTRSVCPCTPCPCTSSIWRDMCSVFMYEDNFLNILLW